MGDYLVEISFGPVQGFIAAARRSRDLWAGSHLLSEVVKAAGLALLDRGAQLIYPLEDRVRGDNKQENSNLSNVLLAKVSVGSGDEAAKLVTDVKEAARNGLKNIAAKSWDDWADRGVGLRRDLWDRQVEDALESYGAWAQIPEHGGEGGSAYRIAYERLKKAFVARKNTRNFEPMFDLFRAHLGNGIPKSSFDGLRESVLPKERERKKFPACFGMSGNEQLDALGCIKRTVGRQERFVALTRLAAHDWLNKLSDEQRRGLATAYDKLVGLSLATRTVTRQKQFESFPYDAGLLFRERLEAEIRNCQDQPDEKEKLGELLEVLKRLWKEYGQPCPYAVMVVADGDRMGMFVDKANEAQEHTEISKAVADFADRVPCIAADHGGVSVFNGGEDLMVLFPLSGVVAGARCLSECFDESMKEVADKLLARHGDAVEYRPTLRVGAAICHVLEPLGVIRRWGDEAEKVAKGDAGSNEQGNALGLVLHIRAGHEIRLRLSFSDTRGFDALENWVAAYRDKKQSGALGSLPGRMGYDIRAIGLTCGLHGFGADVALGEFERLMSRARQSGGADKISAEMVRNLKNRLNCLINSGESSSPGHLDATLSAMLSLADELILSRWLAAIKASDINMQHGGNR